MIHWQWDIADFDTAPIHAILILPTARHSLRKGAFPFYGCDQWLAKDSPSCIPLFVHHPRHITIGVSWFYDFRRYLNGETGMLESSWPLEEWWDVTRVVLGMSLVALKAPALLRILVKLAYGRGPVDREWKRSLKYSAVLIFGCAEWYGLESHAGRSVFPDWSM